eukprot:CAMPEP_0181201692 /NCGR_PEP_ID=MMETSP1096-20121128/18441_1 /TAXON_ID=156174 ORGANISM="Chrysochromulina ericina, Strain CCMP281" /NCGR_SAMPLE_ID=MMETSP1096 /ASSEMBLY_ACC=CAM_ASM_000453 /LENGTH=424 /DNA_ID=CAMNT_0023292149 /DNA_START=509 /DNA_END=1783 /DNA_ORIENTATION=-
MVGVGLAELWPNTGLVQHLCLVPAQDRAHHHMKNADAAGAGFLHSSHIHLACAKPGACKRTGCERSEPEQVVYKYCRNLNTTQHLPRPGRHVPGTAILVSEIDNIGHSLRDWLYLVYMLRNVRNVSMIIHQSWRRTAAYNFGMRAVVQRWYEAELRGRRTRLRWQEAKELKETHCFETLAQKLVPYAYYIPELSTEQRRHGNTSVHQALQKAHLRAQAQGHENLARIRRAAYSYCKVPMEGRASRLVSPVRTTGARVWTHTSKLQSLADELQLPLFEMRFSQGAGANGTGGTTFCDQIRWVALAKVFFAHHGAEVSGLASLAPEGSMVVEVNDQKLRKPSYNVKVFGDLGVPLYTPMCAFGVSTPESRRQGVNCTDYFKQEACRVDLNMSCMLNYLREVLAMVHHNRSTLTSIPNETTSTPYTI